MGRCKDGILLSDEKVSVGRRREERGRQRRLRRWRRGVQHLHLLVLRLLRLFWCVARMRLLAGGLEYRWQTVEERLHRIPRERRVLNWVVHLLLKGTGAVSGAAPPPPPTRLALGIFERRRERERLNIVRPRDPRVARTLFEARCDGSPLRVRLRSLAHSRLRPNERTVAPLHGAQKPVLALSTIPNVASSNARPDNSF